jgi:hypothetical protein
MIIFESDFWDDTGKIYMALTSAGLDIGKDYHWDFDHSGGSIAVQLVNPDLEKFYAIKLGLAAEGVKWTQHTGN